MVCSNSLSTPSAQFTSSCVCCPITLCSGIGLTMPLWGSLWYSNNTMYALWSFVVMCMLCSNGGSRNCASVLLLCQSCCCWVSIVVCSSVPFPCCFSSSDPSLLSSKTSHWSFVVCPGRAAIGFVIVVGADKVGGGCAYIFCACLCCCRAGVGSFGVGVVWLLLGLGGWACCVVS
jgi:hypothetical protein